MRQVISPYVFPGIQGIMARPFPSSYPMPMQVLAVCCEVFESYGRRCPAYSNNEKVRRMRPITLEYVLSGPPRNPALHDLQKLFCLIVHDHCRWLPSAHGHPRPYFSSYVGQFIGWSRSNTTHARNAMASLIKTYSCIREIYYRCLERLMEHHSLDVAPQILDAVRKRAA